TFYDDLTSAELSAHAGVILKLMINEGIAPVHIILDPIRQTGTLRDIHQIRGASQQLLTHAGLGSIVIIRAEDSHSTRVGRLFTSMMGKIFRLRLHYVEGFEDAFKVLRTVDPTLDDMDTPDLLPHPQDR
ncbi:MAG: hypothetical protein AAF125_13330, partial [Chloroflexota bacterium]